MERTDEDTRTTEEIASHLDSAARHPRCLSCSHHHKLHTNRGICARSSATCLEILDLDRDYCSFHTLVRSNQPL